jgi:hypothetical protein
MKNGRNIRKSMGWALICLLAAGVPAHATWNWKLIGAIACTVGGVGVGFAGVPTVGVALIGLQGALLGRAVQVASDPVLAGSTNVPPTYAGPTGPEVCADGGLSCPAAQALLRLEVPPIAIDPAWTPEEIAFVAAANRVIEDGNLFARHSRGGASIEVKTRDLQLMTASLHEAAEAYDRLNLSFALTQDDIDGFQGSIEDAGLPPAEQSFWESTNLTPAEVNAVAQFLAQTHLELRDPSVSMSRILHEEAAELAGK